MDINPAQDNLTITIAMASAIAGALAVAVWRTANFIRDVRDEIKNLGAQIAATWSRQDQERWARALERKNTHIDLQVPEVPEQPTSSHDPSA